MMVVGANIEPDLCPAIANPENDILIYNLDKLNIYHSSERQKQIWQGQDGSHGAKGPVSSLSGSLRPHPGRHKTCI